MVITYTGTCIPARVAVVMTVETKRLQVVWRRLQTAFFTACLLHSVPSSQRLQTARGCLLHLQSFNRLIVILDSR